MEALTIVVGSIVIGIWAYWALDGQSEWDRILDNYFKIDVPNAYKH